jgi:hypothetical protein
VRAISDANALIAERYSYDVYGEAAIFDENGGPLGDFPNPRDPMDDLLSRVPGDRGCHA